MLLNCTVRMAKHIIRLLQTSLTYRMLYTTADLFSADCNISSKTIFTSHPLPWEECKVLRSECLYVCLFVCVSVRSHVSKITYIQNVLYMLPVDVVRSSFDVGAIRYILPALWITSWFHITEHFTSAARLDLHSHSRLVGQDDVMFGRLRQVAAPVGGRGVRTGGELCSKAVRVRVCVCVCVCSGSGSDSTMSGRRNHRSTSDRRFIIDSQVCRVQVWYSAYCSWSRYCRCWWR